MISFPKSTEFNKRIPKQKFYEEMDIKPAVKKLFVEQLHSVYWVNKLAASTVNVSTGEKVTEIEVFKVILNCRDFDETILCQIDKVIPYHIIFLLEYEDKYQMWIGFKEASAENTKNIKVSKYYHTGWTDYNSLELKITGLDMDSVYENFVRQIAGDALEKSGSEDLKTSIEISEKKEKLLKEIARLEKQARTEKQPRKKFELVQKVNALKNELNN